MFLITLMIPWIILASIVYILVYFVRTKKGDSVQIPDILIKSVVIALVGYNLFAHDIQFGLGLGLFFITVLASIALCIGQKKRTVLHSVLYGTGCTASLFFAWRANEFVQGVNLIVALSSFFALLILHNTQAFDWSASWIGKTIWHYILRSLRQFPLVIRSIFSLKVNKKNRVFIAIKTLLLTVVLLVFFGTLLTEADPIFADLIKEFVDQIAERTIMSILIAIGLTVLLSSQFKAPKKEKAQIRFLSYHDALIPQVALTILFGLFLFIQAKYLFGDHVDFRGLDITYSEYVRKGFLELLVTAFFGGIFTYIIALKHRALKDHTQSTILSSINIVFIVELYFLLASALKRDCMYVDMYGLTRVRIIGGVLLTWLAFVLMLILLFNSLKKMKEMHLLSYSGIVSIGVFLILNMINIDRAVVNAVPPRNQPKDFFYINALSADAYSGWKESIVHAQETYESARLKRKLSTSDMKELADSKLSMLLLEQERDHLEERFEDDTKWQNFNNSKLHAYVKIHNEWGLFHNTVSCLIREIQDYEVERSIDLSPMEHERLYAFKYPFVDVSLYRYYPQEISYMKDQWKWDNKRGNNGKAEKCY